MSRGTVYGPPLKRPPPLLLAKPIKEGGGAFLGGAVFHSPGLYIIFYEMG